MKHLVSWMGNCICLWSFKTTIIRIYANVTCHSCYFYSWFQTSFVKVSNLRSSQPEVFLKKDILNKCSKFTGEHPYRSVTSIKLQKTALKLPFWHGYSPVNLLHLFAQIGTPLGGCSNLRKWQKCTLQIIFFFFEWVVITIRYRSNHPEVFLWTLRNFKEHLFLHNTSSGCFCRYVKFWPGFHNYPGLNRFVNFFF